MRCRCVGIGRRGGLKIRWANNPCGFDPRHRHHTLKARKPLIRLGLRAFSIALSALCIDPSHSRKPAISGQFSAVFLEGHWRDVRPLQRGVHTHDRIGGCHFRAEIQVRIRIDVGSRRNIVLFVLPGLLFLFDRLIIRPKKSKKSKEVLSQ